MDSTTVQALQAYLNSRWDVAGFRQKQLDEDGVLGPSTIKALQTLLNNHETKTTGCFAPLAVDGDFGSGSPTVCALQGYLNSHWADISWREAKLAVDGTPGPGMVMALQNYLNVPCEEPSASGSQESTVVKVAQYDAADAQVRSRCVQRFKERGIKLPTLAQLADPTKIPEDIRAQLLEIDPDEPHPLNLFRIHWYNAPDRRGVATVPGHVVLPESLTGVKAPIIVMFGNRFPMIEAHKVLAAYGCLAPRLVNGEFDPSTNMALWPSTGNYCRGGIAVSRIMGCRGVAILPEQMSKERFDWLEKWVSDPADVVKTFGCESNVKEIYDKCNELEQDPKNVIFNQFSEFGNVHAHYHVTGQALGHVFEHVQGARGGDLSLFAFSSATGSAGTISAGDRLKDDFGSKIAAVESVECPTLLRNGFGDHNIQGIGDKHVPFIHNAMNTDFVVGVSDAATDSLSYLFNREAGRKYLRERRGVPDDVIKVLPSFGYSAIANTLAAIRVAKHHDLGADQAVMTVATDGANLYASDEPMILETRFGGRFDEVAAAEAFGRHLLGGGQELKELTHRDRQTIFNLGYYTWVEQQGVSIEDFQARSSQAFWRGLRPEVHKMDAMIEQFNADVAA